MEMRTTIYIDPLTTATFAPIGSRRVEGITSGQRGLDFTGDGDEQDLAIQAIIDSSFLQTIISNNKLLILKYIF